MARYILIEAERTVAVIFPPSLYDELWMLEVDTYTGGVEDAALRGDFIEAMQNAKELSRGYRLVLNKAAYEFMMNDSGALQQHLQIWEENEWEPQKARAAHRAATRLYAQLLKLYGPTL